MKDLVHISWCDENLNKTGGTGITNFDPKDLPIYRKAVEIYGDPNVVISLKPLLGTSDLIRVRTLRDLMSESDEPHSTTGLYSLHHTDKGDLSRFWSIFRNLCIDIDFYKTTTQPTPMKSTVTVIKNAPAPVVVPPTTYTLKFELTERDAIALRTLAGRIGGDANGPRGLFDSIHDQLAKVGVERSDGALDFSTYVHGRGLNVVYFK